MTGQFGDGLPPQEFLWDEALTDDDIVPIVARLRRQGSDDDRTEVKACVSGVGKSVWDSVSAFANTRGGTILLGLDEESGFAPAHGFNVDRVVDQLVAGMGDGGDSGRLTRPPEYRLARVEFDGAPLLRVDIVENVPGTKPCFVTAKGPQGGSYKRIDDKDIRLSPTEVFEFQNALTASEADREIVNEASPKDLDPDIVQRLFDQKSRGKALRGTSSEAERLTRLNITDAKGAIRLAGLLVAGTFPQQFFPRLLVDVTVHPAHEKSMPGASVRFLDRVLCEGPLIEVVDDAVAATARNLRTYAVVEGTQRRDQLEIPVEVLREAVANAVVHREYHELFRGEPVSVDIYPDRVVIANPGGLWGGKTLENIDDGTSRCRNQTLMQLLHDAPGATQGFAVEGQGGGVKFMIHEMRAHALERPVFRADPDRVSVELRRHGAEVPAERAWLRKLVERDLSEQEDAVLLIAGRAGWTSVSTLRDELRIDSDQVRRLLRGLVEEGLLASAGAEEYVFVAGDSPLRQSEIRVWRVLSPNDALSVNEIAERVDRTVNAVRPILRRLIAAGLVEATAPPSSRLRKYVRRSRKPDHSE